MKKFVKYSAVIAAVLILTGGVIFTVSGLCGGFKAAEDRIRNRWEGLQKGVTVLHTVLPDLNTETDIGDENRETTEMENGTGNGSFDAGEIQSLEVETGAGTVDFLKSEDGKIHVRVEGENCKIYEKDGTLHVQGNLNELLDNLIRGKNITFHKTEIFIPEDKVFENVVLSFGGGEVNLGAVCTENMEISAGIADITAEKPEVSGLLEISMGAGELCMSQGTFDDISTSVGVGKISLQGTIAGDVSVDTAVGETELTVSGIQEDYNYAIDCAVGKIVLGKNSYTGVTSEQVIDNGTDRTVSLSCALGDIDVGFTEE